VFLAFCEADDQTTAVAFYLEDDRGADAFFRLAKKMTKPVVLLKGGRTLAGGAAAASHTGALASDPQLLEDVARQSGVLLVENLDQLLDVLSVLQATPDIQGDGLGLIGSGGGVAVVGADTADAWKLSLPRLSDDVLASLERFAAPGTSLTNPIDVPIWSLFKGTESYTGAIIEAAAADDQIDVLCAFLDLGTVFDMHEGQAGDAIVELLTHDLLLAPRKDKLLALVLRSGFAQHQDDLIRRLRLTAAQAGVPMFDSVDRAITAIGGVRTLTRWGKSRLDGVQL
jgi:acyl-CoA synthetase (NDP forming)